MKISCIVAMSENHVIGRDGRLPWHLPDDLKRFKALTTGHTILMGRKTYESIGRPLPDRRNIVLSRNPAFKADGVTTARSLQAALEVAGKEGEVFIIGGEALFGRALEIADTIHLTLVHAEIEGDVRFPAEALKGWTLVEDVHHEADEKHAFAFSYRVYTRVPAPSSD